MRYLLNFTERSKSPSSTGRRSLITLIAAFSLSLAGVQAQTFRDPGFTGNTSYDGWANMNSTNYPDFGRYPGSALWPNPIGSNMPGSGDAELDKISGNGYPLAISSGNYIYITLSGQGALNLDPTNTVGSFSVSSSNVVAGLKNVFFQTFIGAATPLNGVEVEFTNGTGPVLSYNGGAQYLIADYIEVQDLGELSADQGDGHGYIRGFQWDLSSIVDPITSFNITWNNTNHAQIYALQLDQSDTFTAIPEPSTIILLGLAAMAFLALQRKRKASAKI